LANGGIPPSEGVGGESDVSIVLSDVASTTRGALSARSFGPSFGDFIVPSA
jgi:hypothetical protein